MRNLKPFIILIAIMSFTTTFTSCKKDKKENGCNNKGTLVVKNDIEMGSTEGKIDFYHGNVVIATIGYGEEAAIKDIEAGDYNVSTRPSTYLRFPIISV